MNHKWFPILVLAGSTLVSMTVAYTTSNLRLDRIESQKLDRSVFIDSMHARALKDTLNALRWRETQRTLDTLDARTRRIELRQRCGTVPRGMECTP